MAQFEDLSGLLVKYSSLFNLIKTIVIVIVLFIIISILLKFVEKKLLTRAKTKKQISNVEIFTRIFKYLSALILVLFAIFSLSGSLTGLGLTVGLMSAALGFALQKPITSIAAWIMIVLRRPFSIRDRIVIRDIKGDVTDITLSHIFLNEVGGLYGGEERTGRTVMIPNNIIFEESIINYSYRDDFVLGQVIVSVTYESDLNKAIKIALEIANRHTSVLVDESMVHISRREPFVRLTMAASSIDMKLRYFVPYSKMQEVRTEIIKDIHESYSKEKNVEIAYPHTEIVFKDKSLGKRLKNKK